MQHKMKVWSEQRFSSTGEPYEVRLLLTDTEAVHLQEKAVVGPLWQIVGMQEAADMQMLNFEKQTYLQTGGVLQ